ncbi:DUF1365 domain-containing protein [Dyadobacter psychrotolerans]|uniref:DUF1365 domain-containing protein n=1 Tax=Dyadobacter psychrotolerans TaxID=2541721 RepID=A0A4R5DVD0_9BACT|nr:DUF1365 domain-containing protein [Dyadobacter psychrotolerans]
MAADSKSCLYEARVMHHRFHPKKHYFYYDIFMFYLNLDELNGLDSSLKWMSRNKFNLFNFRDKDHLQLPRKKPDKSKNVKEQLTVYLKENGIDIGKGRIMVLTNLATLGYQFNPVSFYYCFDENEKPLCSVVEVCNTFMELKPYFLGPQTTEENKFKLNTAKEFYVSPFIDLDTHFDFNLTVPDQKLDIRIDDFDKNGKLFFNSTLTGKSRELNDKNLLIYFFSFPFITVKVIAMIHWQALLLWKKNIRFNRKSENGDLQKGVFRPYQS